MTDPDGTDTIAYDSLDRISRLTRTSSSSPVVVEDYAYNALGALSLNAGVALDHQRPRLDGGGPADAAVPATLRGQAVTLDPAGHITSLAGTTLEWSLRGHLRQQMTPPVPGVPEFYAVDAYHQRVLTQQGDTSTPAIDPNDVRYAYFSGGAESRRCRPRAPRRPQICISSTGSTTRSASSAETSSSTTSSISPATSVPSVERRRGLRKLSLHGLRQDRRGHGDSDLRPTPPLEGPLAPNLRRHRSLRHARPAVGPGAWQLPQHR